MKMYPLKFRPIYKKRIWGGRKLQEVFGKNLPEGEKIGESWELADLPNDKSVIDNGRFTGQTLGSILEKYPKNLTGDKNFKAPFPLLIKFLDAEKILSVQVHPDRQTCLRMGTGEPKTECWYIISAQPGAFIYKGLKDGVTKEQFTEAIKDGDVEQMLKKFEVKAGQCHLLSAGTLHSIGPGILIAEIQIPSETTYRVFDFNRVDDTGKARPLHIPQALESIHFDASEDNLSVTTRGRLADCEYFKVDKYMPAKNTTLAFEPGKMQVLIILNGCGIISAKDYSPVEFKAGDTMLISFDCEAEIKAAENTEYLTVTV